MTPNELVWSPERLIRYLLITDLDISADGQRIACAIREPILTDEESKFVNHLYWFGADGSEPLRLTYGATNNIFPRWSPDGQYLAFLSDRKGGKLNLYVMRAQGGEAWPLTDVEKDIKAFAWSPDGARLAYIAVAADSEQKKAAKKAKNDPLRVDIDHERARLWVVPLVPGDAKLPTPRALTGEDRHVVTADWLPDGHSIAFSYQFTPGDDHWFETRLAVAAADGEAPALRELAHVASWVPACLTYGDWVACSTGEDLPRWTIAERMVLYSAGGGEPRPLALTPDARPYPIGWSPDGHQVYVLENSRTSSAILALPDDGGQPQTVVDGRGFLSLARASREGMLAFVAQEMDQPNYVAVMRAGEPTWREVFRPHVLDWPIGPMPHSELIRWRAPDGVEIEGLLTLPVGYEPGRAYPTLVMVHGGPMSVYSQSYVAASNLYPIVTFAEKGYVILRANPRGSGGYGPNFRAANKRDWGGGDYRDIMSGLDELIARGIADPQRLGIMGWSYGGYMTSWAVTQTRRFRAASVGAGVTNLMSFNGTT